MKNKKRIFCLVMSVLFVISAACSVSLPAFAVTAAPDVILDSNADYTLDPGVTLNAYNSFVLPYPETVNGVTKHYSVTFNSVDLSGGSYQGFSITDGPTGGRSVSIEVDGTVLVSNLTLAEENTTQIYGKFPAPLSGSNHSIKVTYLGGGTSAWSYYFKSLHLHDIRSAEGEKSFLYCDYDGENAGVSKEYAGKQVLHQLTNDTVLTYNNLDFGNGAGYDLLSVHGLGTESTVSVYLDSTETEPITTFEFNNGGTSGLLLLNNKLSAPITGIHNVIFTFHDPTPRLDNIIDLNIESFRFEQITPTGSNTLIAATDYDAFTDCLIEDGWVKEFKKDRSILQYDNIYFNGSETWFSIVYRIDPSYIAGLDVHLDAADGPIIASVSGRGSGWGDSDAKRMSVPLNQTIVGTHSIYLTPQFAQHVDEQGEPLSGGNTYMPTHLKEFAFSGEVFVGEPQVNQDTGEVSVQVVRFTDVAQPVFLIAGTYRNRYMLEAKTASTTTAAPLNETETLSVQLTPTEGAEIRAFVWDTRELIHPLR